MLSSTSSSKLRKNYYEILGLQSNATSAEIDTAYKKLSSQHHPDKNKNNRQEAQRKFNEICEAYDVLSNKNKRSHYDEMMSKTFVDEDADKTFERFFEEHGMQEQSEKKFFDQYYPDRKKNYYEILGVSRNASMDEIKKSYRKLALKNHPKTNPNNPEIRKKFNEINEAFNALSTQGRRQNYDTLFFGTMAPFRASNIFEDFWGNRFNEIDTMDEMFKPMMRTGWIRDMDKMFNLGDTSAIKNGQTHKSSCYYTNNNGLQTKKTVTTNSKYVNGLPTSETTQEYQFPDGNKEVRKIKDDGYGNVTSKVYNLKKGQALPIMN